MKKRLSGGAINELKAKIQKSIEEAVRFFALKSKMQIN